MTIPISLTLTGAQHKHLRNFLFPGDGKEAVAFLLCGRCEGDRKHRLLVREIQEIPYELCSRSPTHVSWETEVIESVIDRAEAERLSVVKIHSHPNGYSNFSTTDDIADNRLLPAIRGCVEADIPHGSAVMLPDGTMFGRVLMKGGIIQLECINVVGDDLLFWYAGNQERSLPGFVASHAQIFDEGTIERLQKLSIAVVGCSGTGSPVIEQLVRLGVGEIVLVDDDQIEERNVNRILNSTREDANKELPKTDVLGDAIDRFGLGTTVIRVKKNLWNPDVIRKVAQCEIVFGCMDTVDGRYLLNLIATFYSQAYFDVGVRLDTHRQGIKIGSVREVCGTIHYLQPDRSSLLTRGLFTLKQVAEAGLLRTDPAAHAQQAKDGYIKGVEPRRPAVISVNMFAASLAVNEFLARLHPYREDNNSIYSAVTFSLASMELLYEGESPTCKVIAPNVGKGDIYPLLRLPELSERKNK